MGGCPSGCLWKARICSLPTPGLSLVLYPAEIGGRRGSHRVVVDIQDPSPAYSDRRSCNRSFHGGRRSHGHSRGGDQDRGRDVADRDRLTRTLRLWTWCIDGKQEVTNSSLWR